MPFTLLEKGDVLGQKRTGKTKKFLVYKKGNSEEVFKGPYFLKEKRLAGLLERTEIFREWKTPLVTLPLDSFTSTSLSPGVKEKEFTVFVFSNLQGAFPKKISPPYKENFSDYSFPISLDEGLVKLSSIITKREDLLDADLLEGLIHLFITKTGDVGFHNVLYNPETDTVSIIDFEESRTTDYINDPIFFFTKKPGKKYNFYEKWKDCYPVVAERIKKFDFTLPDDITILSQDEVDERVNLALTLLKNPPDVNSPKVVPKGKGKSTNKDLGKSNNEDKPNGKGKGKGKGKPKPTGTPKNSKLGSMTFKGMHGSTTYGGFSISVIKSALQKNIRRGNFDQSLICAFELFAFVDVDGYPIVHNLFNRLSVIATEDISPNDDGLVLASYICGWNSLWVRRNELSWLPYPTDLKDEDKYNPSRLAAIVQTLVEARKSRIMSHLWNAYVRPEGRENFQNTGGELEELNLDVSPTDEDWDLFDSKSVPFLKSSDYNVANGDLALVAIMIYNRLKQKDRNCVGWIGYFVENFCDKKVQVQTRRGRRKAGIVLWEIFSEFISEELLNPIRETYFVASENRPMLQFVFSYILFSGDSLSKGLSLNKVSNIMDDLTYEWGDPNCIDPLRNNKYKVVIEDYMVDLHTGKQGERKVLLKEFKLKGAHVENADLSTHDEVLLNVYN